MATAVRLAFGLLAAAGALAACGKLPAGLPLGGGPPPPPAATPLAPGLADTKPASRELYLKLIADLRAGGRASAALAHLDAYEQTYRASPDSRLLRADCLTDIGHYAPAAEIYGRLLHGPAAAAAHAGLGRIAAARADWPEAARRFEQAAARAPTHVDYLNDLGFAQTQAGDYAAAVFRLTQAAELAPENDRVRNNLIIALTRAGRTNEAAALIAQVGDPGERAQIEAQVRGAETP